MPKNEEVWIYLVCGVFSLAGLLSPSSPLASRGEVLLADVILGGLTGFCAIATWVCWNRT